MDADPSRSGLSPAQPRRIQVRRIKGWRLPAGSVYVGRPTRFGNPFRVAEHGRAEAIRRFEEWLRQPGGAEILTRARAELRGRHLACWCRLDEPCHGDVLLRLVNAP
jgi:hypothetical protein